MTSVLLFLTIIAIGLVAYRLGYVQGLQHGRRAHYLRGRQDGIRLWTEVLEHKRTHLPDEYLHDH